MSSDCDDLRICSSMGGASEVWDVLRREIDHRGLGHRSVAPQTRRKYITCGGRAPIGLSGCVIENFIQPDDSARRYNTCSLIGSMGFSPTTSPSISVRRTR